jgi:hypothetical protein
LVHCSPLLWVVARSFLMLSLSSYRRSMFLSLNRFLLRRSTRRDSTVAAVVADAVHRGVVDHGGVVNVVDVGDIYVVDGTIVEKVAAVPTSAFIAIAEIAESVVDAAVESDMRTPVANVK